MVYLASFLAAARPKEDTPVVSFLGTVFGVMKGSFPSIRSDAVIRKGRGRHGSSKRRLVQSAFVAV